MRGGRADARADVERVRWRRRRGEGEAPEHEEAHAAREGRAVEQLLQHARHQRRVLLASDGYLVRCASPAVGLTRRGRRSSAGAGARGWEKRE